MTRTFLIFLFNLILQEIITQSCLAQQHDTAIKIEYIEIGPPDKTQLQVNKISFNGVRFIDNRIDTSSIGYMLNRHTSGPGANFIYGAEAFLKINFTNGLCTSLNNYFSDQLKFI